MADLSQLRAEAAELLALDEKRTAGEWHAMHKPAPSMSDHGYRRIVEFARKGVRGVYTDGARWTENGWSFGTDADAAFIAAAPRMAALIRKLLEALEEAQVDADKTEKEFEQCLQERDRAQDCLQQTHLNLGGDGEWAARVPTPPPPDSGDLHLDVPALAEEVHAELERLRNPSETAWLCERGGNGPNLYVCIDPSGFFDWTPDVNKALRLCRREDADAVAAIVEDCWRVAEHQWG